MKKRKKQQGGIFRMPAKIMRFFKKPSGILAVLMAVALLGTSSLYAMRAFAEGEIDTVPDEVLSENFEVVTVDHVFAQLDYYDDKLQIFCSAPGVGTRTISYDSSDYENFNTDEIYDENGNNYLPVWNYDTYSVRFTGTIPSKRYYVYQTFEEEEKKVTYYVGSFDIQDQDSIRNVTSDFSPGSLSIDNSGAGNTFDSSLPIKIYDVNTGDYSYYDAVGNSVGENDEWVRKEWNSDNTEMSQKNISLLYHSGADCTYSNEYQMTYVGEIFYKYGPARSVDSGYVSDLSVLIPKNTSAKAYIAPVGFNSESAIANDSSYRSTYNIQSLAGLLGITADMGNVITFDAGYGHSYLPVKVDVKYDNSDWKAIDHVLVKDNDVEDGIIKTVYDNTSDEGTVPEGGFYGNAQFLPEDENETAPQMYYDAEGSFSTVNDVPLAFWSDATKTQNTEMWRLKGDPSEKFSVRGEKPINQIIKDGAYTCAIVNELNLKYIHFTVPVESDFTLPETYTLKYDLNKPDDNLTVTNAAAFAQIGNIPKSQVENGGYTLSDSEPAITGYTFKGWTLNGQAGTAAAGSSVPFTCFNNDDCTATATANWEINKHNVTYNVSGEKPEGYEKPADQSNVEFDTEVTVADVPSYDGYSFSGWYVSGATPDENGKFNMPDQDVTIYGTFTELRYGLDYIENAPDGKTVTGMPQNATNIRYSDVKDGAYTLSATAPDCGEGYRFLGWKLNKTSGNQAAGAAVPFENFDVEGRTATATAQWEEIPKHNVAYTVNKPANSDDITYTAPEAASYYEGTEL